ASAERGALEAVAANDPGKVVQLQVHLRPDVTLEQLVELTHAHRISALHVSMRRNDTERSGRSVAGTFSDLGRARLRQLTRARCLLLVPGADEFLDAMSAAVDAKWIGKWRLASATAYTSAIDALRFVQAHPDFVERVTLVADAGYADRMATAIVFDLEKQ